MNPTGSEKTQQENRHFLKKPRRGPPKCRRPTRMEENCGEDWVRPPTTAYGAMVWQNSGKRHRRPAALHTSEIHPRFLACIRNVQDAKSYLGSQPKCTDSTSAQPHGPFVSLLSFHPANHNNNYHAKPLLIRECKRAWCANVNNSPRSKARYGRP